MISVGITGGIGSGKSEVSRMLLSMGYPVYNSDLEARAIVDTDPEVKREIQSVFGEDMYEKGMLNRPKMAGLVFNDPKLLRQLNAIVHPAVSWHFEVWKQKHSHRELIFQEAAILFESGGYKQVDATVVITAPQELRIERVCRRDGVSPQEVKKRMANQLPQEELETRADFLIVNDGLSPLLPQVIELLEKLLVLNSRA